MIVRAPSRLSSAIIERSMASGTYSTTGIAVRLFLTCWLIYVLHVATNTVREIYPALAMVDHLSFRVDEYANLHPDIFEKPGYGWHINSNPGASMLAAVPYSVFRPLVDRIVQNTNETRKASASQPEYRSPWPMAREFYKKVWDRSYDVKLGLAALVMQAFCMAPLSALGVVAMYYLLIRRFESKTALLLAFLYAFGTPVFFRTGYLNQNLIVGHLGLFGFLALSNSSLSWRMRHLLAGAAGGAATLVDYSGVVILAALFIYGVTFVDTRRLGNTVRSVTVYALGSLGPLMILWFYQWQSFGNPFLPAQRWMPRIAYTDVGYNGISIPHPALMMANLFDYRFGLFTSTPVLLIALAAPFLYIQTQRWITKRDLTFCLATFAGVWLFSSSVGYAWLQFNTGVRYLTAGLPFLFLPFAVVLLRLPGRVRFLIITLAVAQAWCMAMYRDVERGFGVLESILHVLIGGFQLPLLTVLSRMGVQYGDYAAGGVSPLPLFVLTGVLVFGIWSVRLGRTPDQENH